MTQDDIRRAIAQNKSFVGAAFITLFCYWLFYLPGFIFNIMYLMDAHKSAKMAGQTLPGTGCLWILLLLHTVGLAIVCLVIAVVIGVAGTEY